MARTITDRAKDWYGPGNLARMTKVPLGRGRLAFVAALSAARPSSPTPEDFRGAWRDDMGNVFEAERLTPDGYQVEGTITWAPRVGEGTEPWSVRATLLPLNYERIEASSATPGDDATTKEGR